MSRLRRSDWRQPGVTRRRHGRGFAYRDHSGRRVDSDEVLDRIKALAIPPAWTDVWICTDPDGHLQAVGIDDAGRRQYLYHERWRRRRDVEKHELAQRLGLALPTLRTRSRRLLRTRGLHRERVLAAAVRMLDLGLFRIGSEKYAQTNDSYGLATLERSHVAASASGVSFEFPAKSGQIASSTITEPLIARVVADLQRRHDRSPELLGWWDAASHSWVDVKSSHINAYLQELIGATTTAKDFRTWHGSVLMAMHLRDLVADGVRLSGPKLTELYRLVATELGNTATVARNSYVNPRVVDLAAQGLVIDRVRRQRHELVPTAASNALLALLDGQP